MGPGRKTFIIDALMEVTHFDAESSLTPRTGDGEFVLLGSSVAENRIGLLLTDRECDCRSDGLGHSHPARRGTAGWGVPWFMSC